MVASGVYCRDVSVDAHDDLLEALVAGGCPSEPAAEITKRIRFIEQVGIGWAEEPPPAWATDAISEYFRRLRWPADLRVQEAIESTWDIEPQHRYLHHRRAVDRLHDLLVYLTGLSGRQTASSTATLALLDALRATDSGAGPVDEIDSLLVGIDQDILALKGVPYPERDPADVDLEILWLLVHDLAAQPTITWASSGIEIDGYPKNPFEPLSDVITAGYLLDFVGWRFTNAEWSNLGPLPPLPPEQQRLYIVERPS